MTSRFTPTQPEPPTPGAQAASGADRWRVAIVHDYLNQRGGAERVVLEMSSMWPAAPLYTSLYRPGSTFDEFAGREIRTTMLDRLPVDRGFRALFALYPLAFASLGEIDADVVISSSSGWAHGVHTTPAAFHAVYCHTPARWLYGDYAMGSVKRRLLSPAFGPLREWDRRAARHADLYIANSQTTRERVRRVYGLQAPIVYPPVGTERFAPVARGERLLVVSRLLGYKRVDLIVDAATQLGIGLDVVGTGPALAMLRRRAGPSVTFHGRVEEAGVVDLFEACRAYCLPGHEDFGIAPVEALAAGKPVIAFAAGGALETIEDGVSGVLFARQDVASVVDAVRRCEQLDTGADELARLAGRFSVDAFRQRLTEVLAAGLAERSPAPAPRALV